MNAKTDVFVKLALVFFVSLLSFSIGTYVGKKYSDNQHQLASLEPSISGQGEHGEVAAHATTREVASATEGAHGELKSGGGHGSEKKSAVTDEEIAQLAQEFVSEEKTSASEHEEKTIASVEETDHLQASAAAQAIVANKNPSEALADKNNQVAEKRLPTSLPKEYAQSPVGKFTVQIGAFSEELDAQKSAENYKKKGYSAFYIPANLNGKTWYRVSIGQFATQEEAVKYKEELVKDTKVSSAIIQRMSN